LKPGLLDIHQIALKTHILDPQGLHWSQDS